MTKNTKIALGCGGAGCLGLIGLVILVVILIVTEVIKAPGLYNPNRTSNDNYNYNRNSNFNSNTSRNSNTDSPSSTMSEDDKHKLFQAVSATKDNQLLLRVLAKIGFPNGTGPGYNEFMEAHIPWAMRNFEFMESVNTAEKGRAYIEAHIDD